MKQIQMRDEVWNYFIDAAIGLNMEDEPDVLIGLMVDSLKARTSDFKEKHNSIIKRVSDRFLLGLQFGIDTGAIENEQAAIRLLELNEKDIDENLKRPAVWGIEDPQPEDFI